MRFYKTSIIGPAVMMIDVTLSAWDAFVKVHFKYNIFCVEYFGVSINLQDFRGRHLFLFPSQKYCLEKNEESNFPYLWIISAEHLENHLKCQMISYCAGEIPNDWKLISFSGYSRSEALRYWIFLMSFLWRRIKPPSDTRCFCPSWRPAVIYSSVHIPARSKRVPCLSTTDGDKN